MKTTRRQFLKTSAAASASAIFAAPAVVRGQNLNSRLQMACIGTDGKGYGDTREMSEHERVTIVALCDVDLARTKQAVALAPDALVFQDFRAMFAKLEGKIDAVTVSTPDHMHAYITLDAMRRGMHVYCQKPLTHNVWEARQVAAAAKKTGVITRLGNQIHSHEHYRTAVRAIQQGKLGKIKRVHSWVNAPGHGRSGFIDRPKNPPPVPATLDWDLWLGVAPARPYGGEKVYHPWGWRDWQDFGGGALADFGCHVLDPVFTALAITRPPVQVTCTEHSGMNNEVWPCQAEINYVLAGTEYTAGKDLQLTWYHGGLMPGSGAPTNIQLHRSGSLIIGEEGTLHLPHVAPPVFVPEEKFPSENIELVAGGNHYHGFVDGCLSGAQPTDGFDHGAVLTETALLGNVASRFRGEKLQWDAEAFSFPGRDDANRYLTRDYRKGWEIEPVA